MTLQEAIAFVTAERALILEATAGFTHENFNEWRRKRDEAKAAAISRLTAVGAVIRDDWQGTAIKLVGIRCTCTGGLSGALGNWIARAQRATL